DGIRYDLVTGVQTCALPISPEGGLESPRGRREVSRRGGSYHVGVARGVQGDSIGDVIATSAEKGGVDEGGPRGIQLHDEGISLRSEERRVGKECRER